MYIVHIEDQWLLYLYVPCLPHRLATCSVHEETAYCFLEPESLAYHHKNPLLHPTLR